MKKSFGVFASEVEGEIPYSEKLKKDRKKLNDMLESITAQAKTIAIQQSNIKQELNRVGQLIENCDKKPILTDHAVLRYIERTMALDVQMIKDHILSNDMIAKINFAPTAKIPVGNSNYIAVVENKVIKTIIQK